MSQSYPPEKAGQPGSQILPSRTTGFSNSSKDEGYITDEDAVPEYDTNDVSRCVLGKATLPSDIF